MTAGKLTALAASGQPLYAKHDVALLDLDGVVYIGAAAVPGAAEALAATRERGMRLAFVTNNAARPPAAVAAHLTELGISADPGEVITSSQAAARYLAERLPAGTAVLVVGTVGLDEALRERGLRPVYSADDEPAAVVQGYSPTLDWQQLAEGCVAIRRGLPWVATNVDPTVPSARGPLPGNGSLVAALRHATGVEPVVTGKPDPHMHVETVRRTGARRPIVVGDRLDTDIEGANAAQCPSLLVFTGVTTPRELIRARPEHRPTFIAPDLSGLLGTHPGITYSDNEHHCGGWAAWVTQGRLTLAERPHDESPAAGTDDGLCALRALSSAAWEAADAGREWHDVTAADAGAGRELDRLRVG